MSLTTTLYDTLEQGEIAVDPRHREAAVLAVRGGSDQNPFDHSQGLHWAKTGMTHLRNAYAVEERVALLLATLELKLDEQAWIRCTEITKFTVAGDMPPDGGPLLFVIRDSAGKRFREKGVWSSARRCWVADNGQAYAPELVSHWRHYPALPEVST